MLVGASHRAGAAQVLALESALAPSSERPRPVIELHGVTGATHPVPEQLHLHRVGLHLAWLEIPGVLARQLACCERTRR